jgi:DNA repair photolyase
MANTIETLPLFPIWPQGAACSASKAPTATETSGSSLRGIARMADASEALGEERLIEFRALQTRSLLNRSVSKRGLSFAWSINPYRGCEFACRYCYARFTHEYLELRRPEDFERKIFIKQNAPWLLEQELKRVRAGEEIAIGTATDPYQPIERQAKVTRAILDVLARYRGLRIGLVTKSTLIERDIPQLNRIAANNELVLHLTITTPDSRLARLLEPRAPRPDLRLRTVARLRDAGLETGVLCSPLLPGITDTAKALDIMAAKAKDARASFFSAQPLFLKPCSKPTYLGFISEHFPDLEAMYEERFSRAAFASQAYQTRLKALVKAACEKYGLRQRSSGALLRLRNSPVEPRHSIQRAPGAALSLDFGVSS